MWITGIGIGLAFFCIWLAAHYAVLVRVSTGPDVKHEKYGMKNVKMNILVKGNRLSGELETVCPGRRKPIYMRWSR